MAEQQQDQGRTASDASTSGLHAADWLCLAATPTVAVLALLTAAQDMGSAAAICSAARDVWPVNGMALTYGLMSAFHAPPWLRLAFNRRRRKARSQTDRLANGVPRHLPTAPRASQTESPQHAF